jgi:hypothetical protein
MAGGYYGGTSQRESVLASAALLEAAPRGQPKSFFAHSDAREVVADVAFVPFFLWAPSVASKACRELGDAVAAGLPQEYRGESLGVAVVAGLLGETRDAPWEAQVLEGELAEQYRRFKEAEQEGTIQAYERFLEVDTYGGFLEVEAQRRIDDLRDRSPSQAPSE